MSDALRIINASRPCSSARQLEGGPKFCVSRQRGIGSEVFARRTPRQNFVSFLSAEAPGPFAHQINTSLDSISVNDNADNVAIHNFSDRPTGQTFRADVSDARAGRYT